MEEERPPGKRRELETLRQRYQEHRRTIRHLLQTAPDENLAATYEATLGELQRAIEQLDRLDRQTIPERPAVDPHATHPVNQEEEDPAGLTRAVKPERAFEETEFSTQARTWNDPVVRDDSETADRPEVDEGRFSIVPWIAGILLLAAVVAGIAFFWPEGSSVPEEEMGQENAEIVEDVPEEPPVPPRILVAEPASHDFGVIRKGTRSVHRFTIRNRTDTVLPLSVSRSACRCLWYDYPAEVAAGASVELSITVDGARAETGTLAETVVVSSEANADATTEIDLTAEIQER